MRYVHTNNEKRNVRTKGTKNKAPRAIRHVANSATGRRRGKSLPGIRQDFQGRGMPADDTQPSCFVVGFSLAGIIWTHPLMRISFSAFSQLFNAFERPCRLKKCS